MNRTTIILAAVAAVLLAFILIFERDTVSTGELARREGRVLPRFIKQRVARIEVAQGDRKLVLARAPDPELDGELGMWRMVEPVAAAADQEAVETLVGELEWMNARRLLSDISAEDRKSFGLATPRIRVRYQVGSETGQLLVGSESPRGDGHYVQADDPKVAHVVGKDLYEALDHPPVHYHTKELHGGLLLATVNRMQVTLGERRLAFEKRGDRLWLTEPAEGWASDPRLNAFADTLDRLVAKRYAGPVPKDQAALAKYGFDAPMLDAVIYKRTLIEGGEGEEDTFEERVLRLRVGGPCEGHEGERYITAKDVAGEGPVMCVAEAELQPALDALAQPREERLLTLAPDRVRAVEVREAGRTLRVEQRDDGWHYRLEGAGAPQDGQAQEGSVKAWLAFLGVAKAQDFDGGAAQGGPVGAPSLEVTLETQGDDEPYRVAIFQRDGRVMVRRGDEPQLLAFAQSIVTPLHASITPFRALKLLDLPDEALAELRILRGSGEERLVRGQGGALRVASPVEMPADGILGQEVARLLTGLEASQFISDVPASEHGLGTGDAPLKAVFTVAPKGQAQVAHTLTIGAEAQGLGGHYAQLDADPAVFVAPAQLVAKLRQPLISRTALSVPLQALGALAVEAGEKACKVVAASTEGAFGFEGQPASEQARAMVEALATLRVDGVSDYGVAPPAQPVGRLDVTRKGEGEALSIGLGPAQEDGRVPAYLGQLPVAFLLTAEQHQRLTGCP